MVPRRQFPPLLALVPLSGRFAAGHSACSGGVCRPCLAPCRECRLHGGVGGGLRVEEGTWDRIMAQLSTPSGAWMRRGIELVMRGVGLGSLRALAVVSRMHGQAWSMCYLRIHLRSFHLAVESRGSYNFAQPPMYFWSLQEARRNGSQSHSGVETQSPAGSSSNHSALLDMLQATSKPPLPAAFLNQQCLSFRGP